MHRILSGIVVLGLTGCKEEPRPAPVQPPLMPVAAPPSPVTSPVEQPQTPPLPPVAPGSYTNHIGNPEHGHWGPDGQWVWRNPESKEASDTWKFLAAAGAGAAGGAALSMLLSKRHFDTRNPDGQWRPENNRHDEHNYRDKNGAPISREEYERRKAQSERDRARYWERQKAKVKAEREQVARERQQLEQQKRQQVQPQQQSQSKPWMRNSTRTKSRGKRRR